MSCCPGHHFFTQGSISPGIAIQFRFNGQQFPLVVDSHFDPDSGCVPFGVDEETFVAIKEQFDRSPGCIGKQCCMDLTADILLAAKAATHDLTDDTNSILLPAKRLCNLLPIGIGDLRADIDLHASIRSRNCYTAFWFQKSMFGGGCMEGVFKNLICL